MKKTLKIFIKIGTYLFVWLVSFFIFFIIENLCLGLLIVNLSLLFISGVFISGSSLYVFGKIRKNLKIMQIAKKILVYSFWALFVVYSSANVAKALNIPCGVFPETPSLPSF
ncbi:MAG: hypothetical protein KAI72_10835 [Candidatus Pacebacteria bacterium]|nr:hypothetical protein [Candidatus Paceibacterota bacterium]